MTAPQLPAKPLDHKVIRRILAGIMLAMFLSALDQYAGKGEQLERDWSSLDLSQQHAIVSAVLDHVEVGPGRRGYNRFDESRLTPVWRP